MSSDSDIKPPRWADRFLRFYCKPQYLEEIQGDVYELFEARREVSLFKARRLFVWDVLRFFRLSNIRFIEKQQFTQMFMVRNNLKIARRSLWRNKFYTGINLLGISLGIACFVLSSLYVQHEFSFDRFHSNMDRIYRVWIHEFVEGDEYFEGVVPLVMAGPLSTEFPEIDHTVQIKDVVGYYTSEDQLYLSQMLSVVDPAFLKVFDFKLLAGDRETALDKPENVVLTESDALERFGTTEVLGQTVDYELRGKRIEFIVTGVIENPPANSSVNYHTLLGSSNNQRTIHPQSISSWFNYSTEIYVQLKDQASVEALEAKFPKMLETGLGEDYEEGMIQTHLQPLAEVHFDKVIDGETEPGDLQTVQILGVVGFIILVLAGINFVNLSVGQSMKRAREVGVRKVMGAFKKQLIFQFLSESVLLTFFAMLLGILASALLLPVFNDFANTTLQLELGLPLISALLISVLIIGVLSGIYPALVLSSFKPVMVLKGLKSSHKSKNGLAYGLILIQFFTAIFFVSATIISKDQINYLANKDLGFDKEAKVYLRLPRVKGKYNEMDEVMNANFLQAQQVMTSLAGIPDIHQITQSNNYFGDEGWMVFEFKDSGGENREFNYNHIAENFIEFFGIELVAGKSFTSATELEKKTGIIVNEAFVQAYGLEEPIGAKIDQKGFGEHRIIGVTRDFHFASLHEKVKPLVMSVDPSPVYKGIEGISIFQGTQATILAEVPLEKMEVVKTRIKAIWEARFSQPFELLFLDARLEKMYEKEQKTSAMIMLITLLAVIIASLGLLGLAALTIKNRFKEIGIRKVLGATSMNIFQLLYRLFISPVVIAFMISVPVTVWVLQQWLENFAYQVSISVWHFLFSALAVLLITLIAVSYQSLRVARANPVDTIRYE